MYISTEFINRVVLMWLTGWYNKKGAGRLNIEEFRKVFDELYPELYVHAIKFVSDLDTSKDIVQEVLADFWEDNHKLANKKLTRPYLYKAVRNKALNYNKREQRKTGLDTFFDSFSNEPDILITKLFKVKGDFRE